MNVEIGTEAAQFPENEYVNGILVAEHIHLLSAEKARGLKHVSELIKYSEKRGLHDRLLLGPTKPLPYMIRQHRTRDTVLVMSREMTGKVQTGSKPQGADPLPPSSTCSEDR
jgi:hypothetical protein